MSLPSSSVPHQCISEGPDKRCGKSINAGSCGASQGAKIANTTKIETSTTPVVASGLLRAARRKEMAVADIGGQSLLPNPRIDHRVQQVSQKIPGHISEANGQDAALHEVIVTIGNGLNRQTPDSRPGKNGFGHDGSRQHGAELKA